jgi:glycerophosphoryl diester phosphodiesterase
MTHSPKWISHRGNRVDFDENTHAAFSSAIRNGYRHLETDLRVSSDGHVVLWHDLVVKDRGGREHQLSHCSRSQLESLTLPRGGKLLFFDEFYREFGECGWTLDIKPESGGEVVRALVKLNAKDSWVKLTEDLRFLFWRQSHVTLATALQNPIRRYATKRECIRAGLAVAAGLPAWGMINDQLIYSLTPRFGGISLFTSKIVSSFHSRGARVLAFLPATDEDVKAAIRAGFDEILSDFAKPI